MIVLVALASILGCGNACQDLCSAMADYAEECGLKVSGEDVSACESAKATADEAELAECDAASDADELRKRWTCERLAENFTDGAK